ncbi:MAG: ZIP family metal transporter [Candidatus Omnitrophica bacterium]|nr:ZIP family metal transporter [Candidatus Omnitrophota bacterium]
MVNLFWAIFASVAVSLLSLTGVLFLLIKESFLKRILFLFIGFSAGSLIGGAFFHLLPEVLEEKSPEYTFFILLLGFILFFVLERYFYWRHCHQDSCDIHAFRYLNLLGDGIHNFIDGLIIGTSFLVDLKFGMITTLIITFHELPQEIGDFGVLVYGGFKPIKALFYNLISALTCILGTILGYFLSWTLREFSFLLMAFTAGGFLYISASDLIPELHKEINLRRSSLAIFTFLLGMIFIFFAKKIHVH